MAIAFKIAFGSNSVKNFTDKGLGETSGKRNDRSVQRLTGRVSHCITTESQLLRGAGPGVVNKVHHKGDVAKVNTARFIGITCL